MGNGALPNGPSYRAHPRLYLSGHARRGEECPLTGEQQTWADVTFGPDSTAEGSNDLRSVFAVKVLY